MQRRPNHSQSSPGKDADNSTWEPNQANGISSAIRDAIRAAYLPYQLLRPEQLAQLLGLSIKTLANWRCLGRGPKPAKLGPSRGAPVRYAVEDILLWLDELTCWPGNTK